MVFLPLAPRPFPRSAPRRGLVAALSVAVVALGASWSGEAAACFSASNTHMLALGVSRDGASAWYRFASSEARDEDESVFYLLDAAGVEIARLEWSKDGSLPGGGAWNSSGSLDWSALSPREQGPASIDSITARIQRRHGLTPLRPSATPLRINPQGEGCGHVEARTPEGPVNLVDIGSLSMYGNPDCGGLSAALFEHPGSAFYFMKTAYFVPVDDRGTRFDGFELIPRARLSGARAAARGHQAQEGGDLGVALALYDEALRLAPELVQTRIWAAQAAVASGASPAAGLSFLEWPFPDNQRCIGDGARLGEWLDHEAPRAWIDLRHHTAINPWDVCEDRPASIHGSWKAPEREATGEAAEPSDPPEPLPVRRVAPHETVDLPSAAPAALPAGTPTLPLGPPVGLGPDPLSTGESLALSLVTAFVTAFALGFLDRRRRLGSSPGSRR